MHSRPGAGAVLPGDRRTGHATAAGGAGAAAQCSQRARALRCGLHPRPLFIAVVLLRPEAIRRCATSLWQSGRCRRLHSNTCRTAVPPPCAPWAMHSPLQFQQQQKMRPAPALPAPAADDY